MELGPQYSNRQEFEALAIAEAKRILAERKEQMERTAGQSPARYVTFPMMTTFDGPFDKLTYDKEDRKWFIEYWYEETGQKPKEFRIELE